uniref:Uncharacterized protein n=1 Tax=Triticum urartu TaxID=4572 RepID=A0A8R7PVD2_TRIUA
MSTASLSEHLCQCSSTQSTSMRWLSSVSFMMGFCPQVTSRMNTPKENTSVNGVALPVRASSGARYPMVPTTRVASGSLPWSYNLARPKSPIRPLISVSMSTLLALMSRCMIIFSHSS